MPRSTQSLSTSFAPGAKPCGPVSWHRVRGGPTGDWRTPGGVWNHARPGQSAVTPCDLLVAEKQIVAGVHARRPCRPPLRDGAMGERERCDREHAVDGVYVYLYAYSPVPS